MTTPLLVLDDVAASAIRDALEQNVRRAAADVRLASETGRGVRERQRRDDWQRLAIALNHLDNALTAQETTTA